jgi:hypothetical protein
VGALLLALLLNSGASAQSAKDNFTQQLDRLRREQLLEAPSGVPANERAFLDYGAYFTFSYLTADDNLNDNHVLRQYDLVEYARLNFDEAHEVFLRFRTTYRDFNAGDPFESHNGSGLVDPDFDVAYYKFDLSRYEGAYKGKEIDGNLIVKAGRDITYWGNGLVLGTVLDGLTVEVDKGPYTLTGIAGITPVRTVDFDPSRPDYDVDTRRGFYGVMGSMQVGTHKPYAYALFQQDYNHNETLDQAGIKTKFAYDSYYLGFGSSGSLSDRIVYGAEVVYEGGSSQSNSYAITPPSLTQIDQKMDDIQAMAADLRLDYVLQDEHRSRASGELILATGDDDRLDTNTTFNGNKPGTNDRAYNGFGLINTGLAFAPAVSNLAVLRVGISTFPLNGTGPFKRLQVGADVFVYGKFDESAPIDELTTPGKRFLGIEPDVYLNWQMASDVTLALRYGVFFPDHDAFPSDDVRQFFSAGMTFAF